MVDSTQRECMAPGPAAHVLALLAACPRLGSPKDDSAQQQPSPLQQVQLALSFYHISLAVSQFASASWNILSNAADFQLVGTGHISGSGRGTAIGAPEF
jgi:hypothetical protein